MLRTIYGPWYGPQFSLFTPFYVMYGGSLYRKHLFVHTCGFFDIRHIKDITYLCSSFYRLDRSSFSVPVCFEVVLNRKLMSEFPTHHQSLYLESLLKYSDPLYTFPCFSTLLCVKRSLFWRHIDVEFNLSFTVFIVICLFFSGSIFSSL